MGSSGSKPYCGGGASSSSSSSGGRGGISKGRRVFQSACLGSPSGSGEADVDEQIRDHRRSKECGRNCSGGSRKKGECDEVKSDCYGEVKEAQSDDGLSSISSGCPIDEWHRARITNSASGTGSSSARASSTRLMSGPGRILSRFSFVPGNVSFRLGRASSLGSSRAYPVPPTGLAMFNHEDDIEMHQASARYDTENRSALRFDIPESNCLDDVTRTSTLSSSHGEAGDNSCAGVAVDVNLHSPRIFHEVDGIQTRLPDRRIGAREPVERNARFSRTLSVGRLRDRVLRRSSLSEQPFCPLQQQREVRNAPQDTDSQALRDVAVLAETSSMSGQTTSSTSGFLLDIQGHEVEASRSRDHRYHDLLEHRSNFLERRRQVRSQVRALQRLGSRFENLSGHDRSCILSGQHRTGRCTCRMSNRDSNSNDDTNASASISRIVMLAEALFEVLDEIHQQSVVLSSRPSVSSIGSVPAPHEVVESLHVKVYTKSFKLLSDETTQCYICLVEYEDGDSLRVLPCNHEFHRVCIDKWLKEIHRVCPLCRGDICRSDSLPAED